MTVGVAVRPAVLYHTVEAVAAEIGRHGIALYLGADGSARYRGRMVEAVRLLIERFREALLWKLRGDNLRADLEVAYLESQGDPDDYELYSRFVANLREYEEREDDRGATG